MLMNPGSLSLPQPKCTRSPVRLRSAARRRGAARYCHRSRRACKTCLIVRFIRVPAEQYQNPVSWEDLLPPLSRTLRIEPPHSWQILNLRELWEYRELLFFFVWRDVKVRYKQTVLRSEERRVGK